MKKLLFQLDESELQSLWQELSFLFRGEKEKAIIHMSRDASTKRQIKKHIAVITHGRVI